MDSARGVWIRRQSDKWLSAVRMIRLRWREDSFASIVLWAVPKLMSKTCDLVFYFWSPLFLFKTPQIIFCSLKKWLGQSGVFFLQFLSSTTTLKKWLLLQAESHIFLLRGVDCASILSCQIPWDPTTLCLPPIDFEAGNCCMKLIGWLGVSLGLEAIQG